MEYEVTWTIEIDANSFDDAAIIALDIQRDPNSVATHFQVRNKSGVIRELSVSTLPNTKMNKSEQPKGTPQWASR